MRRNDFSGAQEWIGAEALIKSLIVWRLSGRKTSRSCRLVMISVFDGGVGVERGGMPERSRDIGGDRETRRGGEFVGDMIIWF